MKQEFTVPHCPEQNGMVGRVFSIDNRRWLEEITARRMAIASERNATAFAYCAIDAHLHLINARGIDERTDYHVAVGIIADF